ncbi:MAG: protein kinase [Verrucomicrobia bacterium]|nr:protein kinase [Verrucomicrobiota bacterium]
MSAPSTSTGRRLARHEAAALLDGLAAADGATAGDWLSLEPDPARTGRHFGRYELLDEISRGGMGVVYRARQQGAERIVALKVILPHHLGTPEMLARFRGEAEAAAALDHPHILPIHEVGEEQGQPFFSMKFAEGDSLARHARPLAPRAAAELVAKVARAVHHAHQRGILHRDLKPGNILLDAAGEPFVADFGLAKFLDRSSDLTLSQAMLGTPNYIAPEQARGPASGLTTAVDVYGLGAVLYDLLTGRPPIVAASLLETVRAVQDDAPPAPTTLRPDLPRDLEIVCLKCLEKDPSARYASAEALAIDLEHFLAGRPIQARRLGAAAQVWRWSRRNPVAAGLAAALALALVAGTIVSTVAAMRVAAARDRAVAAEQRSNQLLRGSYVAQARATRRTGEAGQRFDSLAVLTRAAALQPGADLRDEAAAVLALADVQRERLLPAVRRRATAPIAFDPASGRIAVESATAGVIELRPAEGDGEPLRLNPAGGPAVQFFTPFAGDGRFLVTRHVGGLARAWDVSARRLVAEWPERPTGGLNALFSFDAALSPDGHELALGGPGGGLTFHDLTRDGLESGRWNSPLVVAAVAWAPDASRLAVAVRGDQIVRLLARRGDAPPVELPHPATVVHGTFSPDGAWLAAGCRDSNIYLWETATGQLRQVLRGHRDGINFLQFHPTAPLLFSTARDKTVRVWNHRAGLPLAVQAAEGAEPNLRFTRDGRLFCGSFEVQPRLLRVAERPVWTALRLPAPGQGESAGLFSALQFSPDGTLLATASRERVRLLSSVDGRELATLPFDPGQEKSVAFDPRGDALYVSSRASGTTRRPLLRVGSDVRFGEPQSIATEPGFLLSAVSGDGRTLVLTSRSAGQIRLLRPDDPAAAPLVLTHPEVWQAALSPDGRWLLTTSTGTSGQPETPRVWQLPEGKLVRELPTIGPSGMGAFSPDGRRLAANGDQWTGLLEVGTWQPGPRLPERTEKSGTFPCYSPDGKWLVIHVIDRLQLLDATTGAPLVALEPPVPFGGLARLAFAPSGERLAAMGPDGALHVWDLKLLRTELQSLGLAW